jgi:hypothetical protein
MVSQNTLNDERKKPAKEMLPVGASVVVSNKRKTFKNCLQGKARTLQRPSTIIK